ncbi:MAG: hypothetical protein JNM02_12550 [Anaerolineales bacterium]|nr:hypothetical protein [Anaerolineales bacterium]
MPRLSVYFVRASLVYLILGFTFGGFLLANKGIMLSPMIWSFLPIHIEFTFIGWMVQLAIGIAFWILPRFSSNTPRGNENWTWGTFILLNIGIICIVLQSLFNTQPLSFIGRVLEVLAFAAFVIGNWKRVKPIGA